MACHCPVSRSIQSLWPPASWMSNTLWVQRLVESFSFRVCRNRYSAVQPNAQNQPKIESTTRATRPMRNIAYTAATWDLCTTKFVLNSERNQSIIIRFNFVHIRCHLPLVHIPIPLSMMNDKNAIITPNKAKYTQSSPSRANELRQIHDSNRTERLDRLPNNSWRSKLRSVAGNHLRLLSDLPYF